MTKLQRSELLTTTASYLDDAGSVTDPQVVVETVSTTKQTEQTFEIETQTAQSTVEEVTLPAKITTIALSFDNSQMAQGETLTATVGLVNVGDETATDLTVTLSLPAGLSSASETKTIDQLAGGATTTMDFSVTAEESGSWLVEVTAEGPDVNRTSGSNTIVVTDDATAGPVERADINNDGKISTKELQEAIQDWATGEIDTKALQKIIRAWATGG
jgi:uncharacterized repeat protein (TIGR01451 family)